MPKRQIQVSLEPETINALDREAAAQNRSRSYVAAQRIEQFDQLVMISKEAHQWLVELPSDGSPFSSTIYPLIAKLSAVLAPFEKEAVME